MALENIPKEEMQKAEKNVSGDDVEIVTRMGVQLLMEGNGLDVIEKAIRQSKEPGLVVGQFFAQLIGQLAEKLAGEIDLDPRVFLAKGGFLENMLNFVEMKLKLPKEFSDEVWSEVVEVIKAAANNPADVNKPALGAPIQQQATPGVQAPEAPPQGMPPQGGM